MEGWFTEKLAFQLRRSTPRAEREERLQQVEGATYRKDLKRKNDGPSKEQKKAKMTGHLGSKEGHGEMTWMKLQRTCLLSHFSCV